MEEDESREFLRMGNEWNDPSSSNDKRESQHHLCPSFKPSDLDFLQTAKLRFHAFVEEIEDEAYTPIRSDILHYCGGQKRPQKFTDAVLGPELLFKKIEVRIDKMLKTKKLKRNWGEEDLKILIWVVSKYSDSRGMQDLQKEMTLEDWKAIASLIPGVTAEGCMFKWLSIKKITLATHNWTKQQSDLLAKIVRGKMGSHQGEIIKEWKNISQDLYNLNPDEEKVFRNAKQCREHWTCYLSPQLKKGPWQLYEDVKLLKFIKENKGLKKWSEIAKNFQGRTENALKNRYTLIVEKQKKLPKNRNKSQLTLISEFLQRCYVDQFTADVKIEQQQSPHESVYREQSQGKPIKRLQLSNSDTNESAITPVRVQKFSINDFEAMSLNFFKNIQPGVIKSDGTFKKIAQEETGLKIEEDLFGKRSFFTLFPTL